MKLKDQLTDWQCYPAGHKPEGTLMFCKFFDAPKCCCNESKNGIQVCYYIYPPLDAFPGRVEVEVAGEKPDGEWVNLLAYTIRDDEGAYEKVMEQARQLIVAWTAIYNASAPTA